MHRLVQRGAEGARWERPADMPELMYLLLTRRGVESSEAARAFLYPDAADLHDPMLLSGMTEAVERIRRAQDAGETVCVYGDYDVDGVCATSILTLYFRALGLNCVHYIPDRHAEGYGLNDAAIEKIAQSASLLVTVDCGISCAHEVETAKALGLDVIVTDHHRPGDILPDCTVINPLLNDYPFPYLCGAGVAFKLVAALGGLEEALSYVDLAALATVADLVTLTDENRVIVSLGLQRINREPRLGLRMMIERASLTGRDLSAGSIGFQIAPRINASGRLGDAKRAFTLLTTSDELEAAALADELEEENTRRRDEEKRVVAECEAMMAHYSLLDHRIIVLCGSGWNSGVIGLAASRLVTEYHYPVILLAESDGVCVGSCRSIPAVDMFKTLSSCADLMTRFGGHRQAAGLAMPRENLETFIARLDEYLAENTQPDDYIPELEYDLTVPLDHIGEGAVRLMERLQPTGWGNPSPVFLTRALIDSAKTVGKDGAHLQVQLEQNGARLQGVCFGQGALAGEIAGSERELLYAPSINEWRGRVSVQCEIKTFLSESPEKVFARFAGKYTRYLRTYLTDILYNIDLNQSAREARPVSENQLRAWLADSPQGTVIAAATLEGAQSLLAFLRAYELTDRVNACCGSWPGDSTAQNAVCLCPTGKPAACRRVVLWDAPAEAFRALPEGALYAAGRKSSGSWMDALYDVNQLRALYVAARKWGDRPIIRMTLYDIERETARNGRLPEDAGLTAGLAVLHDMRLIEIDVNKASLRLLPMRKSNPEDSALYQRLKRIHDYAAE